VQSVEVECGARNISIGKLRESLLRIGAVLELPTDVADVARDAWVSARKANSK